MKVTGYDFCGWASKNNLRCGDGRVIREGAFKAQDGKKVPLMWNHNYSTVDTVLGHAILENRDEGVYAYGFFNDTPQGQKAKKCVEHGDIDAMSIWANDLLQEGHDVLHGVIREVSLVHAGSNPGAFLESVVTHGIAMEDGDDECILYTGDNLILSHAAKEDNKPKEKTPDESEEGETIQDVVDSMTEKQRNVMFALIGEAAESATGGDEDEDEEDDTNKEGNKMKHNIFSDSNDEKDEVNYLSHSDMEKILSEAKRVGSLREAVKLNVEDGSVLVHSAVPTTGMITPEKPVETYGFKSPSMFYPDPKAMSVVPEFIGRDTSWVSKVMSGVHRTPFSRVKSMFANITEEEARARGYIKGKQKKTEVFSTLKRTTSPTTIYKLQKMDRDDILDIRDFDVVAWIRQEMRVMLDEEVARAILIGDGRDGGTDDKISEDCIRPVVKDVDLFNVKVKVNFEGKTTGSDKAKALIDEIIRSHKKYKGSGSPTFYTTEDWLTEMLLIEDQIGHKLYKSTQELATALRVSDIVTVEVMEGYKIGNEDLIGVIVNLKDYNVGQDPNAGYGMFDDFDIDYNRYSYLIETRMSGSLVKPFSAVTITSQPVGE